MSIFYPSFLIRKVFILSVFLIIPLSAFASTTLSLDSPTQLRAITNSGNMVAYPTGGNYLYNAFSPWVVGVSNFTNGAYTVFEIANINDCSSSVSFSGCQSIALSSAQFWVCNSQFSLTECIVPPPSIFGSGTINRLAKFTTSTTTIGNALFSDDGFNTTLVSGNFFLQIGSLIDSVTNGMLNFGTTNATTMNFGRAGQNMIINSKIGVGTDTPTATLHVNGDIIANLINIVPDSLGLDTQTVGVLSIGSTTANSVKIGRTGVTTTILGSLIAGPANLSSLSTASNCSSIVVPADCGSAPAGSVVLPAGGSTLVVNTTAVTANSQILVTEDSSLGTRLGVTCNTAAGRTYMVTARTTGTSFTIQSDKNPVASGACLSYWVVN